MLRFKHRSKEKNCAQYVKTEPKGHSNCLHGLNSELPAALVKSFSCLEHKIGIVLTVSSTLKKPSKNYAILFWDVLDYS